jgi:hypothetical protein
MFLQPGINVPQLKQAAEGIKYGTIMDPFKNKDPKEQGRVKTRILELHGPGSAGFIPDSDIPWSQNERENSFGGQSEMSTFGLPQKGSVIKGRHHGDSKYSPIYSGAIYSAMTKITEWTSKGQAGAGAHAATMAAGDSGGSSGSGGDDGFNQKDHYGHKDPLGNLIHFDMKKKTLTCDFSKLSECNFTFPKTSIKTVDTNHDRTKGYGEDGSPTSIQGKDSGSSSSSGSGGQQQQGQKVAGDFKFDVSGEHFHQNKGKVTRTFDDEESNTTAKDVSLTHKKAFTHKIGGPSTRIVGTSGGGSSSGGAGVATLASSSDDGAAKTVIESSGARSDKYAGKWSSQASNMVWAWLTSRNSMSG